MTAVRVHASPRAPGTRPSPALPADRTGQGHEARLWIAAA